jgi:hypothetical protein
LPTPTTTLARATAAVAVVAGGLFVGFRAYEGLAETRAIVAPQSLAEASEIEQVLDCFSDAVRTLVPPESRLFVDIEESLYRLIAVTAAFPDRTVAPNRSPDAFVLSLRDPSRPAPCEAGAVVVTPPGSTW